MKERKFKLSEDYNLITITDQDQATNIRMLIKACWDSVDQYSMLAQQLNEFGNQQALETVNCLINDLYIAIGSFEDLLTKVDPKSSMMDTPAQVDAAVEVAPQAVMSVAQKPMLPPTPVMVEKFTLDEGNDILAEDVNEKPEMQKDNEKELEKELKTVEKYRKDKVKDSKNPDPEETIKETTQLVDELDEDLDIDKSYDPRFLESLLKLEDD